MENQNEHCKKKIEIDQNQKMTYEQASKLYIDHNGYENYLVEFVDLCEDVKYKVTKIALVPFSGTTRQQFMEAICGHNKTFEQAGSIYKDNPNAIWSIECIVNDCKGGVFKSFRAEYVGYCLSFSK